MSCVPTYEPLMYSNTVSTSNHVLHFPQVGSVVMLAESGFCKTWVVPGQQFVFAILLPCPVTKPILLYSNMHEYCSLTILGPLFPYV